MRYNLRPRKSIKLLGRNHEYHNSYSQNQKENVHSRIGKICKKRNHCVSDINHSVCHEVNNMKGQYVCTTKRLQGGSICKHINSCGDKECFASLTKMLDFNQLRLNGFDDAELVMSCTYNFQRKKMNNMNQDQISTSSCPVEIKVCNYFLTKKSNEKKRMDDSNKRSLKDTGVQTDFKPTNFNNIPISEEQHINKPYKMSGDTDLNLSEHNQSLYQYEKKTLGPKLIRNNNLVQKKTVLSTIPPTLENEYEEISDSTIIISDEEYGDNNEAQYSRNISTYSSNGIDVNVYILTPSNLESLDLKKVCDLAVMFGFRVDTRFTRRTTHVVIRNYEQTPSVTTKYLLGIASRCLIVTMAWIETCLEKKNLVPEDDFIPDGAGPTKCLNVMLRPPFESLTICTQSMSLHSMAPLLQRLCLLCGAKIVRKIHHLGEKWPKPILYLFDSKYRPNISLFNSLENNKLVPVELHWVFACVAYYSVVTITPFLPQWMREANLEHYNIPQEWHQPMFQVN